VWKVKTARALVEGTDYIVIGMYEPDRLARRIDELLMRTHEAEDKVRELEAEKRGDLARI